MIQKYALQPEVKTRRSRHFSLYESYYFALQHGKTSSSKSDNYGIGMSLIMDGARGLGMDLSVFDANSRGILSSIEHITHAQLRRHFYSFAGDLPFSYYGILELKAR